ncbi:FAD-dependent monooxygenase [Nonomuraea sp. NBC_00507]|uniref:FAD-dependent monooxygenase n=1 Tax=Nonomuraea sp. NBC_00507 TaxID=2976002 RepID=UPI002E19E20D
MPNSSVNNVLPGSTDVLIVGAAPVGLALACALRSLGVETVVIDRLSEPLVHTRAAAMQARTLESLATIGVDQELIARGKPTPTLTVRDGKHRLWTTPYAQLDTPYPYILVVPQPTTEAVLAERFAEMGGTVFRDHTLVNMWDQYPGMVATVASKSGELRAIEARYVIGCDGMHSTVRQRMGIAWEGTERPQSFALTEVVMDWHGPDEGIVFFFSPEGLLVVAPLTGENRYRIVALESDSTPPQDLAGIQRLLETRGPADAGAVVHTIERTSKWRVGLRLAETFGETGPVFLAGDAAHVYSPVGGQGMNTGIQDSINLAWKLAAVIDGSASPKLLETYTAERRPVADGLVTMTAQMTDISSILHPERLALRNHIFAAVGGLPEFPSWWARRLAQLEVDYGGGDPEGPQPTVGHRMPPRHGMAQGLAWSLMVPPDADVVAVKEATGQIKTPITVGTADLPHAVLVRPDGYVAMTAPAEDAASLPGRLPGWLQDPRAAQRQK